MNNAEFFFNQLARSRRSVFPDQFEAGKIVNDTIIKEILTNAIRAAYSWKGRTLALY